MSTIKTNTIQPTQAGNNLVFTNGTAVEAMRITDGGLVGIGITPLSELHVVGTQNYGSAANSGILTVGNANNSRQINFGVSDTNSVVWIEGWVPGTGGSNIVLQPSGGSVGIGITAPAANLDVAGGNKQIWIRAGGGGGLAASAGAGLKLEYVSVDSTAKLQAFDYSTNTGKNIALNSAGGNVGIGVVSPAVALDVSGEARSSTSTSYASNDKTLATKDYVDDISNAGGGNRIGTIIVFSGIQRNTAYNRFGITHTANTSTFTLPAGTWNGFVTKMAGGNTDHMQSIVDGSGTITVSSYDVAAEQLAGVITRTA